MAKKAARKKAAKNAPKKASPKAAEKKPSGRSARTARPTSLCIGTIKGAFLLRSTDGRRSWKLSGPFFLGSRVHDLRVDPRDGKTMLLCAAGGHLGPTIYRSTNRGRSWQEATTPPRFASFSRSGMKPGPQTGSRGQSVNLNLWLTPGHAEEPGIWYCGTSPQGLFRTEDAGDTWTSVKGFNEHPKYWDWTGRGKDETPDGPFLHSILVDPRDRDRLWVSLSSGGTFESQDRGRNWTPLNRGVAADFSPKKDMEYGHDPHCVIQHPADPDRLYQQNHCGIYRLDRNTTDTWSRIGEKMPKSIGDIGFPIVAHPTDPDTVWVFPMDGTRVWPRTSPGGKPAVYRTSNGGKSWTRQAKGLPESQAWLTVLRQAMDADDESRHTGIYFGTTSGELWASRNAGDSWKRLCEHLPRIFSVRVSRT